MSALFPAPPANPPSDINIFDPSLHHPALSNKRRRPELHLPFDPYSTMSFKRPRHILTPSSAAISVVTSENDPTAPNLLPSPGHQFPTATTATYPSYHYQPAPPPPPPQPLPQAPLQRSHQLAHPISQLLPHPAHHPQTSLPFSQYPARTPADIHSYPSLQPTPQYFSPPVLHSPPSPSFSDHSSSQSDFDHSAPNEEPSFVSWPADVWVHLLSAEIDDMCRINQRHVITPVSAQYHNFFSQNKQPFQLDFYISRLVQYANCSTAAFVLMLIYVDRVQEKCKQLLVTEMNCHRVILTSLVLAIKYLDDEVFSNAHYARVGGVTPKEMNELEVKMLKLLDWNLSVSPDTYRFYEEGLVECAAQVSPSVLPTSPASPI